jgi:uncharacterized cupin superfamily protein
MGMSAAVKKQRYFTRQGGQHEIPEVDASSSPGVESATHLHEVDEEVLYVVSGEIVVTLGENEYTVAQGGLAFAPPGFGWR